MNCKIQSYLNLVLFILVIILGYLYSKKVNENKGYIKQRTTLEVQDSTLKIKNQELDSINLYLKTYIQSTSEDISKRLRDTIKVVQTHVQRSKNITNLPISEQVILLSRNLSQKSSLR